MKILIYIILFLLPITGFSETYNTNLNNVVIKKPRCRPSAPADVVFIVSNRGSSSIDNQLIITAFDQDRDPIGQGNGRIRLGPVSGNKFTIKINCERESTFVFKFQ